ncbi:SMI1/KNR4 family protein [Pectobacterium aroidearum]|uniref:SMI1/KNR4 family protein n=1 Tax=Pectobacterium aroidearum TaxID=1201031 RepID=UPI0015DFEB21|nr:SMI1/KNR4 family protein [Pectobacterium aroidearum]MBA0204364.1 SMI1/KNR4 family protein [Pectobacterium aroidearum]
MKPINDIVDEIKRNRRCKIFPVNSKLPPLSSSHLYYPDDLICFYNICGGAVLFEAGKDNVSFEILPPDDIVQTNVVILGEECLFDISSTWYTICRTDNGDYISIDFSKERNGRCYDSNHEIHGVPGSCPIVSLSFEELLNKLYDTDGKDVFWNSKNYGDAYG